MTYRFIHASREGHTAIIRVDNPPVNALHPDVSDEILAGARAAEVDPEVRSLILTGTGRCFVAGGDVKYFRTLDRKGAEEMALRVQGMQKTLYGLRVPVVVALNGHALGGGLELMMSCDIAIAEEQVLMGLTEVKLGLIPGAGGTRMLTQLVAPGTARRMLFTGDKITAAEAKAIGLVDQVTPTGGSRAAALELCARINAAGPHAVAAAKRSAIWGMPHSLDLGHEREAAIFGSLFDEDDHMEGVNAFVERRPPKWNVR